MTYRADHLISRGADHLERCWIGINDLTRLGVNDNYAGLYSV
jgi:hypothetical protein